MSTYTQSDAYGNKSSNYSVSSAQESLFSGAMIPFYRQQTFKPESLKDIELELGAQREASLADRIFGRQLLQGSLTLGHQRYLADRRRRMYEEHQTRISRWQNDIQNQKEHTGRFYFSSGQELLGLERLQLQLEADRHREAVTFWKDMAELYSLVIEESFAHAAARQRYELLGALEKNV